MSEPLVSFIVTTYNLPVTMLRGCLESILQLTLRPSEREIILVDDGSQQSPLEALTDLADEIIYVRQRNAGLSEARNTGLQLSRGQFVQFVDGDDGLLRVPYEHCLDLARYGKADMVLFSFSHQPVGSSDAVYDVSPVLTGIDYLRQHNLRGSACCYLFKRSLLGELRFTPGIFHEDEEFTPQLMLRAEKVCETSALAYYYRQRDHSIVNTATLSHLQKKRDDFKGIIMRLHIMADRLPSQERLALQRRVAQLTMDFVYQQIVQTRSYDEVNAQLEDLRQQGLFPLPDRDYTAKYRWFRKMSSSSWGLRMLVLTLPRLAKER